jgi:hypothetical protein
MYLDTDVVLARLKVEDWLKSFVSLDALENPVTSTSTVIEVQYVMEDDWNRERLGRVSSEIEDEGIELVPLTTEDMETAGELREKYDALGVFDSVHLGAASTRNIPIVSTDTLYPSITEVQHTDPRDLET